MQQILGTKGELHLTHQHVQCEHGSDEIDKHLHEGKVASHHHLLKHWTAWEPKLDLVDHPNANWDIIPVALDKIYNFVRPRTIYLDILGDAVVIPKLVQSFVVVD